jgi:lysophospholipase L1-like esterase
MWKSLGQPEARLPTIGSVRGGLISCPPTNGDFAVNRIKLRSAFLTATALVALLFAAFLSAQEPGNVPETKAPPPAATPEQVTPPAAQTAPVKPAAPTAGEIATRPMSREEQMKNDWPWLGKFKEADLALGLPAPGENRVVFMGDSITEGWHFEGAQGSFAGKPYINRGISGQTTPQMVLRFRQDVIALQPKVVVILAGINDIAENTGPMTLEQTEDNLASMSELAASNHIRVVLCSVLPAFDFPWHPGMTPAGKVLALNAWIKGYAEQKGHVYVDYHTAMKDDRDGLPATLSQDGVHPLPAGYAVMAPLVEVGIQKALAQ